MTTRQLIIQSALFLFNRFGFVNVRLQHIADEAGISVGNLAYHFKTKDDIVEHIYEEIVEEQKRLLSDLRMIPLFVNLDEHLQNIFQIQQKYSFFFTDSLEVLRAYGSIKRKHREHLQWQTIQTRLFLEFNVARGALLPSKEPDSLGQLASRYVFYTNAWLSYEIVSGHSMQDISAEIFKSAVWALLAPYFSLTGLNEYQQMRNLPFDGQG